MPFFLVKIFPNVELLDIGGRGRWGGAMGKKKLKMYAFRQILCVCGEHICPGLSCQISLTPNVGKADQVWTVWACREEKIYWGAKSTPPPTELPFHSYCIEEEKVPSNQLLTAILHNANWFYLCYFSIVWLLYRVHLEVFSTWTCLSAS